MKKVLLLASALFYVQYVSALNITIIESQSINAGHDMDTEWYNLLTLLGHTATIQQQTTLDDTLFFTNTDILIVSSGVITLTPNRVTTIQQYLQYGGKVYLQAEYLTTYTSNQAFQSIVTALGGTFSWTGNTSGDLIPMTVLGTLGSTPNSVVPLNHFWYGTPGTGCNGIEPFLLYNTDGLHYGFVFCCPASAGRMITTSDQDWIRTADSVDFDLMENIIYNLSLSNYACSSIGQPLVITISNDTLIASSASAYQWYLNNVLITGAINQTYFPTQPGYYHVCVTYSNDCTDCSDSVYVKTVLTGINEQADENAFHIYSDLSHGGLTIEGNMQNAVLSILDATARTVYTVKIVSRTTYTLHQRFSRGIYFVQLRDGEKIFTKKLFID
jgi:hypothetical protein